MDEADPPGLYASTNTGAIFYSLDEGDSWQLMFPTLPPVLSIKTAVI